MRNIWTYVGNIWKHMGNNTGLYLWEIYMGIMGIPSGNQTLLTGHLRIDFTGFSQQRMEIYRNKLRYIL